MMRHVLFILLLFCGTLFSAFGQTVNIEKIEVRFVDVTGDPAGKSGPDCFTNPADHLIGVNIQLGTLPPSPSTYVVTANQKGDNFQEQNNGLIGNKKMGQILLKWYCSYYQANADTQVAYEMVSCLTEYEADGKERRSWDEKNADNPTFNTYGDNLVTRVYFPNVTNRVKLYFTFRIRKRQSYELRVNDLIPFLEPIGTLKLHYYTGASGGSSLLKKGNRVWGNALLLAAYPSSTSFNLAPMGAGNVVYDEIPKISDNPIGTRRRAWLITGDVLSWQQIPGDIEVRYTHNTAYTLDLYSISGSKIATVAPYKYLLPQGTKVYFRVRLASGQVCKKVESFKLTTDDGTLDLKAEPYYENNVLYYQTEMPHVLQKKITNITAVLVENNFSVSYESPYNGCAITITKKEGGDVVPKGTSLPCASKLLISVNPPATGETIKSVTLLRNGLPVQPLARNAAGFWVAKNTDTEYKLSSDIQAIEVLLNPVIHTLTYNSTSACGTFTVKDDTGTLRASGSSFAADYLTLEATVTPPKEFFLFRVTYADGTQVVRSSNPAQVDFNQNITAIELECGEQVTMAVTASDYIVSLLSGKFRNNDGDYVEEVGHLFPSSTTPYTLQRLSVVRIKVPDTYVVKPLTRFVVSFADGTKQTESLTTTHRNLDITLNKSVTKIELQAETFFKITYSEGVNKPQLKLKEKRAFSVDETELTPLSVIPSGTFIQASGKVELVVNGVHPTPGKLIQKFVVVMGGVEHEYLPSATQWEFAVNADITEVKVIEVDDPAVTGPFKVKWQEIPAVYTVRVDYPGATPPVISGGALIPKNTLITVTVTLTDAEAGVLEGVKIKLENSTTLQELTPSRTANVYTYTFNLLSDTEVLIAAHNRQRFTVDYVIPANYTLFVRTPKGATTNIAPHTSVLEATKLYIRAEKNTPDAEEFTFEGIKVNGTLIPETDKDGEFYVFVVNANVTSIEAVYTPKPKFNVVYATPTDYTLFVGKDQAVLLPSGSEVLGGTKIYIKAEKTLNPEEYTFNGVKVNGVFLSEAAKEGGYYVYVVNANVTSIEAVYTPKPKFNVVYATPADYTLFVGKDQAVLLPSGSEVLGGTKIYIKAEKTLNPEEYTFNGIKVNGVFLSEAAKEGGYYVYVVNANVTSIEAVYTPKPKFNVVYATPADYMLFVGKDQVVVLPSGSQVLGGTKIYIKAEKTLNPEEYTFNGIKVNGVFLSETAKEDEYYVYVVNANVTSIEAVYTAKPKYTVVYVETPADYTLFVGKDQVVALPSGSQVLGGTKLYIKAERTLEPEHYRFLGIKVNGTLIPVTLEDDFYTYVVNAPITSIEAAYQQKAQYTVTYVTEQTKATVQVKNTKDDALVPSGTLLYEGTQLQIGIVLKNPVEQITKVKLVYAGSAEPILIMPDVNGRYLFSLTDNVMSIEVESEFISKYTVEFDNSGKVRYTVLTDRYNTQTALASGAQVDAGSKIWVRVMNVNAPNMQPKGVYVMRRNPKFIAPPDPEFVAESIDANRALGAAGATYYSYVVRSNVELKAFYDEEKLPTLHFRYENAEKYTLDVRSDSPSNTTPVVAGHWYEYKPGTRIYVKLQIKPSLPNSSRYLVSRIFVNELPVTLEKENDWYVLTLTGDIYSLFFELTEVPANKSMLVYSNPVDAHLTVYNAGTSVASGTVLPQGTPLFAVVSENAPGSLFSILTRNGIITAHHLTNDVHSAREGMSFTMSNEAITEVVAYVATPLPENNQTTYHITVEKPEHGILRLEKVGDPNKKILQGETKEAKAGELFEVITSSDDSKLYELAASSIDKYTRLQEGTNKPIFTVPVLAEGETHLRVVMVYVPVRPTCIVNWSLNAGGTVAVSNVTESNATVNAGSKVPVGDYIKYTLTPQAGYRIRSCYLNGRAVKVSNEPSYEATLRIDTDVLLDVAFELTATAPDTPTAIDDTLSFAEVSVHPNPFDNVIYVRLETRYDDACYELINAQGMIVRCGVLYDFNTIDTRDLPVGLYLLRLRAQSGVGRTLRIIKN